MFIKITKREAFKRFALGKIVVLCPCKCRPGLPFGPHSYISGSDVVVKGVAPIIAWKRMYDNWVYYNATWETGYYAHYYKEE